MTRAESWEEQNSQYLATAVCWLKLLLERRASGKQQSAEAKTQSTSRVRQRKPSDTSTVRSDDDALTRAALEMAEAESTMDPPPALVILSRRLNLSEFEQTVLLLCAAIEFDTGVAGLCALAQQDPGRAYPTFALALSMADDPAWDALSPERPLRYWRLIEVNQPGGQSLTTSPLRADERIVNYIKGLNYLDDRLAPFLAAEEVFGDEEELPASQQSAVNKIIHSWRRPSTGSQLAVVQLLGSDSGSKLMVASYAAAGIGRRLFRLQAELLPAQLTDLETLARLWHRESMLLPVALYLDTHEVDAPSDALAASVRRFLSRSEGLFFLSVREIWSRLGRDSTALDIAKPAPDEQRRAWEAALGGVNAESPAQLAAQFNLNLSEIHEIAQLVRSDDVEGHFLLPRVWDACRARVRPRLDSLAQHLDPRATWSDIVLPNDEVHLLRQIAAQVSQRSKVYGEWGFARKMNRGLGISALFVGESGTGKTMAAEVIANELRLNLYRVDLSAVVSKYIGETEKNLRRLFDAAEDGGAILFFDEADALFGKRSEVKDSHDRYANIEINYLLQRMEGYRGLAILATNMRSAMDTAFTRRLRFIVSFPFPGFADRTLMWQKAFPPETPTQQLDYGRLARLNLTGGSIHNAALNAAFLAAQAGTPVNMTLALAAMKSEFIKLERPINEVDFRWREPEEEVA
jgi:ATP-dependent 26S proteasome regulatory subunit